MKKFLTIGVLAAMTVTLSACSWLSDEAEDATEETTEAPAEDAATEEAATEPAGE